MTEEVFTLAAEHKTEQSTLPQDPAEDEGTRSPATSRGLDTYGSFLIDEMEFALPVGVVQEVVNEPETVSAIPLSPSYMIGLFNLRGMIVPMIDLREIFGFPPTTATGHRKIVIIEDGETHLGLVFDRTGEVIHARPSEQISFKNRDGGLRDVVSQGVLKLDNGERILQTLDPHEVLNLEKVPRVQKDKADLQRRSQLGKRMHCISFEVGHSKYAFELEHVQEVMEVPEIKQSFLTHGYVLGSISLRGRIVPIVDFRGFVGKQRTDSAKIRASQSKKLLIMNLNEGQIGLLVYSIDSIIPYYQKDVLPISKLAMPHEAIFKGCLPVNNSELVMLFDHYETMRQPDLVAAAQCCQELYPDGENVVQQQSVATLKRRTFITFSADTDFAMDISQVREVIDCPDDLMKPPNAAPAVAGLFNLREEIITLIDPRLLYNLPQALDCKQKIVIFQSAEQKYGMLVDTVNEIIMTTSDKVLPFQSGAAQLSDGPSAQDVKEMVQTNTNGTGPKSVMVLDVVAFVQRCVGG